MHDVHLSSDTVRLIKNAHWLTRQNKGFSFLRPFICTTKSTSSVSEQHSAATRSSHYHSQSEASMALHSPRQVSHRCVEPFQKKLHLSVWIYTHWLLRSVHAALRMREKKKLKPQVIAITQAGAKAIIATNQTPSHRCTKTVSLFMDAEGVEEVCLVVVVGRGATQRWQFNWKSGEGGRLLTHCLLIALQACRMSAAGRNTGIVSSLCFCRSHASLACFDWSHSFIQSVSQSVGTSLRLRRLAIITRSNSCVGLSDLPLHGKTEIKCKWKKLKNIKNVQFDWPMVNKSPKK